ncbi:MAG: anti-anti-sigma factor [Gammaproteobacteria bacterium]|nr:MAG: anti-anti-sigma factor [Gammaproteobacteria bacterium]
MQNIEVITLSAGNYLIKGDLTFSTINKASVKIFDFKRIASTIDSGINIDLQQLGKIDSAGLALLIEWVKFSRTYKKELRFNNIPTQLTALAKLSYLSEIDIFTTKNN